MERSAQEIYSPVCIEDGHGPKRCTLGRCALLTDKEALEALERSQPILPLRPGIPARQTHDYIRHGTTTLFAALNVLEGTVVGTCLPRHRHTEFLTCLERIDRTSPRRREIHLILDHDGTHTHQTVDAWFAEITRQRIRRGRFRSVPALITAIRAYLREHHHHPRPFIWTATASKIMRKIRYCKEALETEQQCGRRNADRASFVSLTPRSCPPLPR